MCTGNGCNQANRWSLFNSLSGYWESLIFKRLVKRYWYAQTLLTKTPVKRDFRFNTFRTGSVYSCLRIHLVTVEFRLGNMSNAFTVYIYIFDGIFLSRLPAIRLLYYHAGAPDLFNYQISRCPRGRSVRIVLMTHHRLFINLGVENIFTGMF